LSPWEGKNALDAAVLAYTNIALLRQQTEPTRRVHGIIEGNDWTPNSESCLLFNTGHAFENRDVRDSHSG
jgi:hypothetical protein